MFARILALRLASRGYLLETGRVVTERNTAELRANDYVGDYLPFDSHGKFP